MHMKTRSQIFKIITTCVFAIAILAMYFIVNLKDVYPDILSFACVAASALLSLIFLRVNSKNAFLTIGLLANVAADLFLVPRLFDLPVDKSNLIGVCIFCGVQFMYVLYTLSICKGLGLKLFNIGIRVAVCLLAYFVLRRYFVLDMVEWISVMYALNCVVTIFCLLINFKKNWVLFFGMLLLLACDVVVGLTNGGLEILKISGSFADILMTYDIAFICYIPAVLLIAISSVWENRKKKGEK